MKISLTDFIDYVSKTGATKYSKVKEIKKRDEYKPEFDFWKPLRDVIIITHKKGINKKELYKVLTKINDKKKERYNTLIKQYISFLGRKKIEWFNPPSKKWKYNELTIHINPELGLDINNELHVIKLYFKAEKLSQKKADLILLLMNTILNKKGNKDIKYCVLDIERKKLYCKTKLDKEHFSIIEGEALSFINVWNKMKF